jgi:hypothetical protein
MERDWGRTIRARNARELGAAAVLAALVLSAEGPRLRTAPLLAAIGWVAWFIARYACWRAKPEDGGLGIRRELIRQGNLLMAAWIWYVLPLLVGGLLSVPTAGWTRALFIGFGIALSVVNYHAGKKLVAEGNR